MLIAGVAGVQLRRDRRKHPGQHPRVADGWELTPTTFLILVNVILLILGCILEGTAILLIIVPVFIPTAQALGIDMVHFGVVVVVNIMLGLVTPPYGLLLFIMTNISGAPVKDIIRDAAPFIFWMVVCLSSSPSCRKPSSSCPACWATRDNAMTADIKPLYVLNGPNLNRLGKREPEIYGKTTLAEVEAFCRDAAGDWKVEFRQTNSEERMIDWIHEAIDEGSAIIINPAGWTFTSIAILDALKMFPGPIIEFHISNVHRREAIYHKSLVSMTATAVMAGLGAEGYGIAVAAIRDLVRRRQR